jgi:hypothetical protein
MSTLDDPGEWDVTVDDVEAATTADEPATVFANVGEFVTQHLAVLYARPVGPQAAHRWSPRWWECAEAISRLEALWRAWEALRQEPALGMSVWWRDHADHHMGILLSPDGPFRGSDAQNAKGQPLPCERPPTGLFGGS